jgi:colanic acid biosynthesis glycosyl transferase WcaI
VTGDQAGQPRLLVMNLYYDTVEATGRLLRQLCEELAKDMRVEVIAARPPAADEVQSRAAQAGVSLFLVGSTRLPKRWLVSRLLNYLTFMAGVLALALRRPRPDVVKCMTDPPVVGLVGAAVAWLRRSKFLLVTKDVHPDVGLVSGALTNPLAVAILRFVQRLLLRRADHVVVISEAMRVCLIERGARPEQVSMIRDWADLDRIRPQPRDNWWSEREGLNGSFTVMHAGNIGMLQSLDTLLTAAARLRNVTFVIVGEGSRKQALMRRAEAEGLSHVRFLPYQPDDALPYLLASADVHVVSLLPGLAGFVEPSKIYGVLAAARPVIAAIDERTDTASFVRDTGCGLVVPPSDHSALADALERLAALPAEKRTEMGAAGRRLAETSCSRQTATGAYRRLLLSLADYGQASPRYGPEPSGGPSRRMSGRSGA